MNVDSCVERCQTIKVFGKLVVDWYDMICNTNGYVLFQVFPFLTTALLEMKMRGKQSHERS